MMIYLTRRMADTNSLRLDAYDGRRGK